MTVTGVKQPNGDESNSLDSFESFGNINLSDFVLPDIPPLNDAANSMRPCNDSQNIASESGGTTPQYSESPVFSPLTQSPRPMPSPMVAMSIQSPSGNVQHHSRPASTNSAPPASPYGQPICSPQVPLNQQQQQQQQINQMMGAQQHMRNPQTMPNHTVQMNVSNNNVPVTTTVNVSVPNTTYSVQRVPSMDRPPTVAVPNRGPVPQQMGQGPVPQQMNLMGNPRMMQTMQQFPMAGGAFGMNRMPQPLFNPGYRMCQFNKTLFQRDTYQEAAWWDWFTNEFFEDDAILTISICLDGAPNTYNVNRMMIPRFFKSIYDAGAVELYFNLRYTREWYQGNSIMLDSHHCAMETMYVKPIQTSLRTEGCLIVEFLANERMRIKSWCFRVEQWQEHIPRGLLNMQVPELIRLYSTNYSRHGFPKHTLSFLRMCCIMQPMQQLMTMQKATGMDPRTCLSTMLVQERQNAEEQKQIPVAAPQGKTRPAPKPRKKRKAAADKEGTTTRGKKPSPEPRRAAVADERMPNIMVVGEPSTMGGPTGNDYERFITRVNNAQYTQNVTQANAFPGASHQNPAMQGSAALNEGSGWPINSMFNPTMSNFPN